MYRRPGSFRFRHPLPLLSVLLIILSLLFFPLSRGSMLTDVPEVMFPLAVALGIALYSVRLLRAEYDADRIDRIAAHGWTGAITTALCIWLLSQQLRPDLAFSLLLDEALTVLSLGSGIAVFFGANVVHDQRSENPAPRSESRTDRDRVLAETVWTNDSLPDPILTAVTTQLAELEGVDPLELEPLYEHVDPGVFSELKAQDDSHWQLLFYTDEYEVRVSSQGTVTIYEKISPNDGSETGLSESEW